jgi:hypothetical protein
MEGMASAQDLRRAVDLALAGDWHGAHALAQEDETGELSCWLHACLHKIEGDAGNARYWYARTRRSFEDFPDPRMELAAIRTALG